MDASNNRKVMAAAENISNNRDSIKKNSNIVIGEF
jgi:hypothetical protein